MSLFQNTYCKERGLLVLNIILDSWNLKEIFLVGPFTQAHQSVGRMYVFDSLLGMQ